MASIGDVFIRLVAETTGFSAQIEREAVKAGDKAGTKLGQTMGQKAGRALATGIGAAIGGVLGTASALGAELDTATKNFAADVGATAEEAALAQTQIAGLYRSNIISFQQASDTLAALRTDLGLTQEEAGAAAEAFVDFAKVTRQDSAEAVRMMDDILDNWNLTAEDAQAVMDQLVVSHQKYGGSIAENEETLAKLAPALTAANFEIEDGIALLGLFGAKGLDSERAAAAFSKALTKVESPEELQALIDDISSTEDPFLRAQKAADLFGVKAGTQLANALAGADLDDYVVGMDEAAGATQRAADIIDSSFGTQVQLALRNFGGALAEAATNFGPLILGISQLGGKRAATAIGAAVGGLAGNLGSRIAGVLGKVFSGKTVSDAVSKGLAAGLDTGMSAGVDAAAKSGGVKAAIGRLGASLGGSLGSSMAAAMVPILIGAIAGIRIGQEQTDNVGRVIGTQFGQSIRTASLVELERMRTDVIDKLNFAKSLGPLGDFSGLTGLFTRALADIEAQIELAGGRLPGALADGMQGDRWEVEDAAEDLTGAVEDGLDGMPGVASDAADDTTDALYEGLRSGLDETERAAEELTEALENEMDPMKRIAGLEAQLAGDALARGLRSKDPLVREAALAYKTSLEVELAKLRAAGRAGGSGAGQGVVDGLAASKAAVIRATRGLVQSIRSVLVTTPKGQVRVKVDVISGGGFSGYRQHGGPVWPGGTYMVGEAGRELFVPSVPGTIVPNAELPKVLAPTNTSTTNITVNGVRDARLPFEIVEQQRRLERFVELRTRPSKGVA
jgi:phage-related minor tail protein